MSRAQSEMNGPSAGGAGSQLVVLLAYAIDETSQDVVLDEHVRYRPDLARKGPRTLARALSIERPSILLTSSSLDVGAASAWRAALPDAPLLAICGMPGAESRDALLALGIAVHTLLPAAGDEPCALTALRLAERIWTRSITCDGLAAWRRSVRAAGRRVALVGGGIVNLMTALALARDGRDVTVFDASPDPRADADPRLYGCTRGGDNGRMFTLTEADNYNDKRFEPSGDINVLLDRPVSACGWQIRDERPLVEAERRWIDEYRDTTPWLAHRYTEDIHSFNSQAGDLWDELRQSDPGLFDGVDLRDGILRLYTDLQHFHAQVVRQRSVGALRRVLTVPEIAERHPAMRDACAGGAIVGGIEVVGFTVAIHDFVARLVDLLERLGVHLRFDDRVEGLHHEGDTVAGLVTATGIEEADHFVISPGAYGDELLRHTASRGQIQGVIGVWLTVPNLEPRLEHSLKIGRRGHTAEDSNVTVAHDRDGRPALILGSGYGWVGLDPTNIGPIELEGLFAAVEDTARTFFPRGYAAARESGMLVASRRMCVRPWTASSLGIFETLSARGGGAAIVTGAHNTGGFAQAPVVADAVVRALRGEHHPMHVLYHPDRRRRFLGDRPATLALAVADVAAGADG
jgi:glycine/D-amino acid oxidase-like deaminating enzyme